MPNVEDNLYTNDGRYFTLTEPADQRKEGADEEGQTHAILPLLRELLERFDSRITFYDSVSSVPEDVMTSPDEFMHTVAANKLAKNNLILERDYIQGLIDKHIKEL